MNIKYSIRNMKKILFATFVLMTATAQVVGQDMKSILDGVNKIGENELIENAVKDGFVLVDSYYALQNNSNGKKYGSDSHDYFGHICYLGYSMPNGYLTIADAATPWAVDERFDDFRDNERYSPVLLDSIMVRHADGSNTIRARLGNTIKELDETGLLKLENDERDMQRLIAASEAANKGWLVFAMIPKKLNGVISAKTALTFTSKSYTAGGNNTIITTPNRDKETIVGGLFVVPVQKGVGQIELQVCGFLTKTEEADKWKLVMGKNEWYQAAAKPEVPVAEEEGVVEESEDNAEEPFKVPGKDKKKKKPSLNRIK